jgi:dienelactone hydrolase
MQRVTKTRFTFPSEGETLVGNLFLPQGPKPAGVVVAVGPLTSVKEQATGAYARALAERGYAGLAFDYRYFGESDGRPRQFEDPDANIEDIRNAATALLAHDRLTNLRLFGLGICFGAGPMVRAVAADSRFRAFAGVAGVYTDNAKTRARMGAAYGVIEVSVLIVHWENALTPDLAHAFYSAVRSPKQELWLRSQGRIDFYDDPKLITRAADAVAAFTSESS